ncbi:MAG: hypothetical protein R3C44_03545 [Chloroflexota bacterium]
MRVRQGQETEREAIQLTARLEGILLDPVYTGRAMGGLIDLIRWGAFHTRAACSVLAHRRNGNFTGVCRPFTHLAGV